jgi:hypothetical protein
MRPYFAWRSVGVFGLSWSALLMITLLQASGQTVFVKELRVFPFAVLPEASGTPHCLTEV